MGKVKHKGRKRRFSSRVGAGEPCYCSFLQSSLPVKVIPVHHPPARHLAHKHTQMKVWADTRLVIKQPENHMCVCAWVCAVGFEITASHKRCSSVSLSLSCEPNLEIFSWMELAVCVSGWALSVTGRYFCHKWLHQPRLWFY